MKLLKIKKSTVPEPRRSRLRAEPSANSTAFSSYQRRPDQPNTGRQMLNRDSLRPAVVRAGSFWLKRYGLAILLVAIIICAVDVISLADNPKIEPLTAQSNTVYVRSTADYQRAAAILFRQSIWNRNKLTVNTTGIAAKLKSQFPELQTVDIGLPLIGHRPIIYLQTAQPAFILHASNGSFLLDTTGKALLAGSQFTGIEVPSIADQSGVDVKLDHQALTASNVAFIQTVISQLAARKFTVSTMVLPAAASELDVQISGQPYTIKFDLQSDDARQQAGTYLALQARLASQGITPAHYIDVRVDGRAYYQ